MFVIQLPDANNSLQGRFVLQVTPKGISGVSGINYHPSSPQYFHGLSDQAQLGIVRMYIKNLGHPGFTLSAKNREPITVSYRTTKTFHSGYNHHITFENHNPEAQT